MELYRITTARWAGILSGSGYPARWNSKGAYVIYTATSRALACLENLVHRSGEGFNSNFCITVIEAPSDSSITYIAEDQLPSGWYKRTREPVCRQLGDRWISEGDHLLMQVPSSIIRDEFNLLINPGHPDFDTISVKEITDFSFDARL